MDTNNTNKIILPKTSYLITGVCFYVHNQLGRFCREKQYSDAIELRLKGLKINHKREFRIKDTGNIVDFLIESDEGKLLLEVKAKRLVLKEDFYQAQRYLQALNLPLNLIVNFRNQYIKPIRIVKIETEAKRRFVSFVH